jgi:hypothetical protein
MQHYADFNNFIGFGQFASIDLRVDIRTMVSARKVKTLAVSTKLPEYLLLDGSKFQTRELFKSLSGALDNLVEMCLNQNLTELAILVENVSEDAKLIVEKGGIDAATSYIIERLFFLNHGCDLAWDASTGIRVTV